MGRRNRMGYYITLREYKLKLSSDVVQKLINGLKGFTWNKLEYFEYSEGKLYPVDYSFKLVDEFEEELVFLSRAGVKGFLVFTGEEGEYFKYVLDGEGKVEVYDQLEILYSSKPSCVLG